MKTTKAETKTITKTQLLTNPDEEGAGLGHEPVDHVLEDPRRGADQSQHDVRHAEVTAKEGHRDQGP